MRGRLITCGLLSIGLPPDHGNPSGVANNLPGRAKTKELRKAPRLEPRPESTAVLFSIPAHGDILVLSNKEHAKPMTCSWCDKKISFFGAFGNSRYCCEGHRKKDYEKMRELAIQRLRNTP